MTNEKSGLEGALLQAVAESPDDVTPWHALHDLLLEADDPRLDFVRFQLALRGVAVEGSPSRQELDDRLRDLLVEDRQEPVVPTLTNSIGMPLALIPPGTFLMGSPEDEYDRSDDEGPQHEVEISRPFFLGVHLVTQGQFWRVMGQNPSHFSATGEGKDEVAGLDTVAFPVENVTWEEAVEFCRRLSALPEEQSQGRLYRLPTEAEWEHGCRAGAVTYRLFHFGNAITYELANVDGELLETEDEEEEEGDEGEGLGRPCPVGQYPPNAFGLHDLHGNVWEWCADWYDQSYFQNSPRRDPQGPDEGEMRVFRGGGWNDSGADCRTAYRYGCPPASRNRFLGFRVVLVAGPAGK